MSPLPGWRLVWSLYGRFWCRSSLEILRQWRTGALHVVKGHVARSAQTPPRAGGRQYGSEVIYLFRLRSEVRCIQQ